MYDRPVEVCFLSVNDITLFCYILPNFKAILWFNLSVHCTVLFTKNATSPAD